MRVLKVCINEWNNASRDKRELSVIRELGEEPVVIAKGATEDRGRVDEVAGYKVLRYSTRPLGDTRSLTKLNRIFSIFTWAKYVRAYKADLITCHNLPALTICYLASLGMRHKNKPVLVYDCHEFEVEHDAGWSKLTKLTVKMQEKFLMKRCAFSIMVNDSIANEVQRLHGLKERPLVIRSTPPRWQLDTQKIAQQRKAYCEKLGLPESTFIVMYHGGLLRDRGIENMLRAVARIEGTAAVVLGDGDGTGYVDELHALVRELGIEKRVLFHPAVEHERLREYVGAADVGTVMLMPVVKNHYYTLPNKFFESIQAMTPVIVSDFPEVGRLTREYGIGETVDPANVEQIAAAICELKDNKQKYAEYKINLVRAKEELCWEREKVALKETYEKVLSKCNT